MLRLWITSVVTPQKKLSEMSQSLYASPKLVPVRPLSLLLSNKRDKLLSPGQFGASHESLLGKTCPGYDVMSDDTLQQGKTLAEAWQSFAPGSSAAEQSKPPPSKIASIHGS